MERSQDSMWKTSTKTKKVEIYGLSFLAARGYLYTKKGKKWAYMQNKFSMRVYMQILILGRIHANSNMEVGMHAKKT